MADYETFSVSDKVGIGTENPLAQLHIASSTSTPSQAFLESGGALLKITVDSSGASIGTDNAFPFKILTDNSSRLSITDDGNVGIGTNTTPTERLEVDGNVKANSFFGNGADLDGIVKKAGDNTMTGSLTIDNNLTVNGAIATKQLSVTDRVTGSLTVENNLTVGNAIATKEVNATGKIQANRFEGDGSGLDGIVRKAGDTMTGALTVNGAISTQQFSVTDRVTGSLTIENDLIVDGKVGIGTPNPIQALDMGGLRKNIKFYYTHLGETGSGAATIIANKARVSETTDNCVDYSLGNGDGVSAIELLYTNGISFFTKPTDISNPTVEGDQFFSVADRTYERMRISSTGNVGIGTTNPQAKLEVNGAATVTNGSNFANTANFMTSGSLTIGGTNKNYGGGRGWNENTAGLLMETKNNTEIAIHDSDTRLASLMYYEGDKNKITIGRDMGWGSLAHLEINSDISGGNLEFSRPVGTTGTNKIQFTRNFFFDGDPGDSTDNLKLSLSTKFRGQAEPSYKFRIGHSIRIGRVSRFVSKLSVDQTGDVDVAGRLSCQNLRVLSGNKSGYVSDHFVNAVGDPIEQGDVVVLSDHPVSMFCATHNDVPIPEVDLTNRAYDTRICGIVAKVTTEDDLPYVEKETSEIPPEILEQLPPEVLQGQLPLEELPEKIVASLQAPHPYQSLAAQTQEKMNFTVVQDQQMGSMVTMGCFSYCKVDADIAAIAVGDLLTTSPTKGHAQKVLEPERAIGAIIGKALSSLSSGKEKIPVLVMLQ